MSTLRLLKQKHTRKAFLAALVFIVAHTLTPVYAQLGTQQIVLDLTASKGWTAVVPMNINGDGLTDLLSYNATTGRTVYSVATTVPGAQQVVLDVTASKGWTAIVPMNINGDGLTDLLSYNATTGRAVYSVATSVPGAQQTVVDLTASKGWTAVVPMNINGDGLTKKRREAPSFTAGRDRRWARRARCPSGQSDPGDSRALNGRGEHGSGGPVLQGGEDVHRSPVL